MQTEKPYKLLSRQQPLDHKVKLQASYKDIVTWFADDQVLAVDYETTGLQMHFDENYAVGIGISNGQIGAYVDLQKISEADKADLYLFLHKKDLVFHNVTFDAGVYWKESGQYPTVHMCTSAVFRYLATEGWLGQSYLLKTAMVDILGWDEPNTEELYSWLKEHKLGKGDMWQAPAQILGHYCALDAIATYHLYTYFSTILKKFPRLVDYINDEFEPLAKLIVVQQFNGIKINTEKLERYVITLNQQLKDILAGFFNHPDIKPHIDLFNSNIIANLHTNMPVQHTKIGKISKNWERRMNKIAEAEQTNHFKITSKPQLCWLFYERLGYKPYKFTATGRPQIDKNVLPTLGEHGQIINNYNKILKELQYVKTCLSMCRDGVLNPMFKVPGTNTGRLSGGYQE